MLSIGQKISYLTIKDIYRKNTSNGKERKPSNRKFYLCLCDCGNEVERRDDYLKKCIRDNIISSCGCKHPTKRTGIDNPGWKGHGRISGYYFGCITGKARKKNWTMTITKKYIWDLYLKQNKKCALTGMDIEIKESKRSSEVDEMTASLDRIDSMKGYVPGNVQWVHKDINRMKNNYDQDYFLEMCTNVANHQRKPMKKITHDISDGLDKIADRIIQNLDFAK